MIELRERNIGAERESNVEYIFNATEQLIEVPRS